MPAGVALPIILRQRMLGTYSIVARQTIRLPPPPGLAQITQGTPVVHRTAQLVTVLTRERNRSLARILMKCMVIQKQIVGRMLRDPHPRAVEELERHLTPRILVPRELQVTHGLKRHMDNLALPVSLDKIILLPTVQPHLPLPHPRPHPLHPAPHLHLRRCSPSLVLR